MCVLSLAPSGETQTEGDLWSACINNPDGFGYAIHTGRHIMRRRSMNASHIIDRYLEDRYRYPDGPAMFHARIATSGRVDNSGCHPFYVDHNPKVVLGHNGILPIADDELGWKSDTRFLAEDILDIESLAYPKFVDALSQWIGKANKLVILSADQTLPLFTIVNESAGHWDSGIWWSNYSYAWLPKRSWADVRDLVPSVIADGEPIEYDFEYCPHCNAVIDPYELEEGDRCPMCWTNLDVHTDSQYCLCYKCASSKYEEF